MKKITKTTAFISALCLSVSLLSSLPVGAAEGVMGDVDGDGYLTGHDAAMVSRYLHEGDVDFTEAQLEIADVDGNGTIEQADADWIYENRQYNLADSRKTGDLSHRPDIVDAYNALCYDSLRAVYSDVQDFPEEYFDFTVLNDPLVQNLMDFTGNGKVTLTDAYLTMTVDGYYWIELDCWIEVYQNGRYYIDFSDPRFQDGSGDHGWGAAMNPETGEEILVKDDENGNFGPEGDLDGLLHR